MARTKNILSKIVRNLQRYAIPIDAILDQEIYDELVLAQDRIISESFTDKIITIILKDGVGSYALTTNVIDPLLPEPEERKNIASVKISKLPVGWTSSDGISDYGNIPAYPNGFNIVSNEDFANIINANQSKTGRPRIATIIGGSLQVYPVPNADVNDIEIELFVYLSSSAGLIDADNEPEVPNYYDKALEIYATAQFIDAASRNDLLSEFAVEVRRTRSIYNRKHHPIVRKPISGFL